MADWFPVLTGLIGTGVGATVSLGADLVNFKRGERLAVRQWSQHLEDEHARWLRDQESAHSTWRRDRAVAALEAGFASINAVVATSHPDHEAWKRELARVNLLIRLYCGASVQGAYSAVKDGMLLVSENLNRADDRVMLALGEATSYMQLAARHDLAIDGSEADVEEAKQKFLSTMQTMRTQTQHKPPESSP